MTPRDHGYPLAPDLSLEATLAPDGALGLEPVPSTIEAMDFSWLLEVDYRATARLATPGVAVHQRGEQHFVQYLEPRQRGRRWLNLTGIDTLEDIRLETRHCRLGTSARLLGFRRPDLEAGPLMIVAPHPDDAELAAFGLYGRLADQAWIVTLSAGERQKRLDRQYLPGLDRDGASADRRKGWIRAWNSATTPLLAGLVPERLIQLGYFNDSLSDLLASPEKTFPQASDPELRPAAFRRWNHQALPSDADAANCGRLLLEDLTHLMREIRPATLVVTHPEVDPHGDHIAAARACAQALERADYTPVRVLLYANHLRKVRGFPYGPAHAAAGLWPLHQADSRLGPWGFHSEVLSLEVQRRKAVAMDSMHDLRASLRLEKRLKRALRRRLSGIPLEDYADYGDHDYFQTHIKAHEPFVMVDGAAFRRFAVAE